MSYKKQQPKLTDTLDVFIDRVEAINDSIKKLNHFNNELDQKINSVQNLKLKVDLTELKNESSKINSSLNGISKDTISVFRHEMGSFNQTVGKLSNFKINYIIYFFVILFLITTLSCFLTASLWQWCYRFCSNLAEQPVPVQYLLQRNEVARYSPFH